MYQVLLPVDNSESRGRAQADAVLGLPEADESVQVTLLYVFGDEDRAETTSPNQILGGKTAYDRLQAAGVTVNRMSRVGDPAAEILAAADEVEADCIVLGGRKRSPGRSLIFGSVSQAVTLEAQRPVTITGAE